MKKSLLPSLFVTTLILSMSSLSAQLASVWDLTSSGPNQILIHKLSEPGEYFEQLTSGGIDYKVGAGYAWMRGINDITQSDSNYAINKGRTDFRIDQIDFAVAESTSVTLTHELLYAAEGRGQIYFEGTIQHRNSSGSMIQSYFSRERRYFDQSGTDLYSTPITIVLNPGDYLYLQGFKLEIQATVSDQNNNGVQDSASDVLYSDILGSYGLKIDTDASFSSLLGGTYTGAQPLIIPEPSTYAAIAGGLLFGAVVMRRMNKTA